MVLLRGERIEASGQSYKQIKCTGPDGKEIEVAILSSGDRIEIGGYNFKRDALLFAVGVNHTDLPGWGVQDE